jgi:hypothetical protein
MSKVKQGKTKQSLQLSIDIQLLNKIKAKAEKENFKISNKVENFFQSLLAEA